MLIGTFPLDPSRRHIAPSAATDVLVGRAGQVWAQLLLDCRQERAAGRAGPRPARPRAARLAGRRGRRRDPRGRPGRDPLGAGAHRRRRRPWRRPAGRRRARGAVDLRPGRPRRPGRLGRGPRAARRHAARPRPPPRAPLGRDGRSRRAVARGGPGVAAPRLRRSSPRPPATCSASSPPCRCRCATAAWSTEHAGSSSSTPSSMTRGARRAGRRRSAHRRPAGRAPRPGAARCRPARRGRARAPSRPALVGARRASPAGPDDEDEARRRGAPGPARAGGDRASRAIGPPEPWWGEVLLEAEDGEPGPGSRADPARARPPPSGSTPTSCRGSPAGWWSAGAGRSSLAASAAGSRRCGSTIPVVADGIDGWAEYLDERRPARRRRGRRRQSSSPSPISTPSCLSPGRSVLAALAGGGWTEALAPSGGPTAAALPRTRAGGCVGGPRSARTGRSSFRAAHRRGALSLLPPPPAVVAGLVGPAGPAAVALLHALGGVSSADQVDGAGWAVVLDGLDRTPRVDLAVAVDLWRALGVAAAAASDPLDEIASAARPRDRGALAVRCESSRPRRSPSSTSCGSSWPAACPALVVPTAEVELVAEALDLDDGRGPRSRPGHVDRAAHGDARRARSTCSPALRRAGSSTRT